MSKKNLLETIGFLSLVISIWIIKFFIIDIFNVSWHSMDTSLYDKEKILVSEYQRYLNLNKVITRWDIIIFDSRIEDRTTLGRNFYIKRVIWLPWDEIMLENWKVYLKEKDWVNYHELKESYLSPKSIWKTYLLEKNPERTIYIVPPKSFFVLWDNRLNSSDSRTCFIDSCEFTSHTNFVKFSDFYWKYIY